MRAWPEELSSWAYKYFPSSQTAELQHVLGGRAADLQTFSWQEVDLQAQTGWPASRSAGCFLPASWLLLAASLKVVI
jgi:hypothetical protein